jgi:hypothetical protein
MNDFVSDVSVGLLVGRFVDGQVSRNWCGSKVPKRRSSWSFFFLFLGKYSAAFHLPNMV